MDTTTVEDEKGRKYKAYTEGELVIKIGPPEGLVDALGLPEPFATNLHNILFQRNVLSYEDVRKNSNNLLGALQEALRIDAQILSEEFFKYRQEASNGK